jgi:hypothetical protein
VRKHANAQVPKGTPTADEDGDVGIENVHSEVRERRSGAKGRTSAPRTCAMGGPMFDPSGRPERTTRTLGASEMQGGGLPIDVDPRKKLANRLRTA